MTMKITAAAITLTVDLTGVPDYDAQGSFDSRSRVLRPRAADVNPRGEVIVIGSWIKKNGEPYEAETRVEYAEWVKDVAGQPEFVRQARRIAKDFYAEAMNAWEVRDAS